VKALVFGGDATEQVPDPGPDAPRLVRHLAVTPMALADVPEPEVRGPDWAVLRSSRGTTGAITCAFQF
jgi:hypothetical protein